MCDMPQKSAVILIPGSSHPEITEKAAQLYHEGFAPYILPSGKFSSKLGHFPSERIADSRYSGDYATEHAYCKHILMANGVPESAILQEDQSTNTMENAAFSAHVLRSIGLEVRQAILCCQAYHARRAYLSYACHFPDTKLLVVPSPTQGIRAEDWYRNEKSYQKVLQELAKCGIYFTDHMSAIVDEK